MTQKQMAEATGSSHRTVSRWEAGHSSPSASELQKVAALLHPVDPELATEAARWGGTTPEQLGIVGPAASPARAGVQQGPASIPQPVPLQVLVDALVCEVASALEKAEGAPVRIAGARAAAAAAFACARRLHLDLDEAIEALGPAAESAVPQPALRARR